MNALIRRWQEPRSFGTLVLHVVVPRALVFASIAAVLLVGNVMRMNPSAARLAPTIIEPTWSAAARAADPDCLPSDQWPSGVPGSAVIVHRYSDGETVRVPFMTAWKANHDASEANDLWVLGVCP